MVNCLCFLSKVIISPPRRVRLFREISSESQGTVRSDSFSCNVKPVVRECRGVTEAEGA